MSQRNKESGSKTPGQMEEENSQSSLGSNRGQNVSIEFELSRFMLLIGNLNILSSGGAQLEPIIPDRGKSPVEID
jgi:hypothetical protein